MSHRLIRLLATFVLVVSLGACSPPALPDQFPFAEPGVEFSVVPDGIGCTPEGAYRGKVSWEVPGAMSSKIEIQVGGEDHKVFARSNESSGSETTGDWVNAGMVFVMRDRDTDMVLAALKAGPGQCDAGVQPAEKTGN